MKKYFEIALGIITSIGGFLEAGSIATSAQAGATYRFQLIWPLVLGTICVIFLIEMSGRLAAISQHPLPAATRERFGFNFYIIPLVAESIVDLLVLASEIGGACIGMQLMTGVYFVYWAIPVAVFTWLLLWIGNFEMIEYGVSTLGLITIVFIVAAWKMHPPGGELLKGVIPTLPQHEKVHYWFLAVSIIGATISPYLFNFYSSGAVEDEWGEDHLGPNRAIATIGMSFGSIISIAVLIAAGCVLFPNHIDPQRYEQIALETTTPLGRWGFWLFGAGLFIACLGAALELSLDISYVYSQAFGWNWGENEKPANATRFAGVFTIFILLATAIVLSGINPVKLTLFSMAITTVILPLIVLPFLVLMNDPAYLHEHTNGRIGNFVVFFSIILASILAIVAIPLEIFGGS